MIVGACVLKLYLPGVYSLKEKRHVLKPLLNDLRRTFEVAAAEVGNQDVWQSAEVALAAVGNDSGHLYAVLEKAVHWVEDECRHIEVQDWEVELR
ncbi:MAG: DUF503 domain-containing protein [Anaerolineae bacterium]|nr:DUF503 domain-containing protein [Anaerolineae bacterium]